jgi:hypothetical protein
MVRDKDGWPLVKDIDSEWVPWDSKTPCPFPYQTRVTVKLSGGTVIPVSTAGLWAWDRNGPVKAPTYVTAYKRVQYHG